MNLKLLVVLIHHNESTMGSQSSLNTQTHWYMNKYPPHGSKTKDMSKPSDPIGWEIRFGPKMFILGSKSMVWKKILKWHLFDITFLSNLVGPNPKKYSLFDKLIFKLGSSLGFGSTLFWTPSFLDLDLDLKPTLTWPSINYIRKRLKCCKVVTSNEQYWSPTLRVKTTPNFNGHVVILKFRGKLSRSDLW